MIVPVVTVLVLMTVAAITGLFYVIVVTVVVPLLLVAWTLQVSMIEASVNEFFLLSLSWFL